jgi:hypothetical protein
MRRLWIVPIASVVLIAPCAVLAGGGDGGFNGVVRSIETRYHAHATRIPFVGLMSFISGRATHGGVGNLHIAEFESFDADVDGDELNAMVAEKLGAGWERMIRETSRHGSEQTLIFCRPEGSRMGLFVVDSERGEMDIVQVSVNPDRLNDSISHYGHRHDWDDDDGAGGDKD